MDFWMIARQDLKQDLLDIFSALGNLQYQYDWVISDHGLWYGENCPDDVRKRWQWTGLLMDGRELTEHLSAGYVSFLWGGVLSAVPKGTPLSQVRNYEPYWEIEAFDSPEYQFQTPLTQLELLCYDGYAWVLICDQAFSKRVKEALPMAKNPEAFYAAP